WWAPVVSGIGRADDQYLIAERAALSLVIQERHVDRPVGCDDGRRESGVVLIAACHGAGRPLPRAKRARAADLGAGRPRRAAVARPHEEERPLGLDVLSVLLSRPGDVSASAAAAR